MAQPSPLPNVTAHQVVGWLRDGFGIDAVSMEPVTHGTDDRALLWRARTASARYAVKLTTRDPSAGLALAAQLARAGVHGVPTPLSTRDGALWSDHDGARLSVMPWVSGHRALDGSIGAAHWAALGRLLRGLHDTAPPVGVALPREEHDHRAHAALGRELRPRLTDGSSDRHPDALVRKLAALGRHVDEAGAGLVAAADTLLAQLRGDHALYVACHGDPHLGNVMLDGPRVWLIDWDDAVLAPRERDLMFVTGGVLAFAPVADEQRAAFFTGYGPVEPDPRRLAYYQCVRALEDLLHPAAQVLDVDGRDEAARAASLSIVEAVLSPTGLVPRALADAAKVPRAT